MHKKSPIIDCLYNNTIYGQFWRLKVTKGQIKGSSISENIPYDV